VNVNELPLWPSGGNRRKLDELWLEKLERYGLPVSLEDQIKAPAELDRAILEFNRQLFWECHETLEDVWRSSSYPIRMFYRVGYGFRHEHPGRYASSSSWPGTKLLGCISGHTTP